jgi:hypothetical protein
VVAAPARWVLSFTLWKVSIAMNSYLTGSLRLGLAVCLFALHSATASAATSFSNSLTGFTGDSTVAGTQAALGAAGFNFFSIEGLAVDFSSDPTVAFDSEGAHFGSLFGGDGGRNYVRTNDSDYATVNFTAQVTIVTSNLQAMDVFLGLGPGDIRDPSTGCCWGWPDWGLLASAVLVLPEITDQGDPLLTTLGTQNDVPVFLNTAAPGLGDGIHRMQLVFDATAKTAVFSLDMNYTGGAYTADLSAPAIDTSLLFAADGWPSEPSRIYFGGDDNAIFKDFSVVVEDASGQEGDFNGDEAVDGRDFLVWQRGGSPNALSAGDLALWQTHYGVGGLAAITSVPEPASILLLIIGTVAVTGRKVPL